jgi:hypothetical protein
VFLSENPDPASIVKSVLDATDITAVVSVDDAYADPFAVEEVRTLYKLIPEEQVGPIFAELQEVRVGDPDVTDNDLNRVWPDLPPGTKRKILWKLKEASAQITDIEKLDFQALSNLPGLFADKVFVAMSLTEWNNNGSDMLASRDRKILVLMDQDLSHDGGGAEYGIELVRGILAENPAGDVVCALLTHKYQDNVDDAWSDMASKYNLDKSHFLVIPKAVLATDPIEFARLVKLAAINRPFEDLKTQVLKIIQDAVAEAEKDLAKNNIYDLDEMVFRSSYEEGVWEPETLFRVFGIFHRTLVRTAALKDKTLHDLSTGIRSLSGIPTSSKSAPRHRIWEIQRQENFDSAAFINELHRPTDLGDIYETGSGRKFILIAPHCDLMVRGGSGLRGKHSDLLKEVVLAEITGNGRTNASWKLDYYEQDVPCFVDFKKLIVMSLNALDFCVFNTNGECKFSVDAPPPAFLIPAWSLRYEKICKIVKGTITRYRKIDQQGNGQGHIAELVTSSCRSSLITGSIDLATNTVSYNFRRSERLLDPRATALLNSYCRYLGRDAFEHPLETPPAVPSPPESQNN